MKFSLFVCKIFDVMYVRKFYSLTCLCIVFFFVQHYLSNFHAALSIHNLGGRVRDDVLYITLHFTKLLATQVIRHRILI